MAAPRWPSSKPGVGSDVVSDFMHKMLKSILVGVWSQFLAWIFGGDPEDYVDVDEEDPDVNLTTIRTSFDSWLTNLPIIGDVVKVVQGITTGLTGALATAAGLVGLRWDQVDSHEDGFVGLVGGYTGTPTPPTQPALEAIGANLQTRITNLENGGQQWLLANSDTIDLSGFTEVKVWMWPASNRSGLTNSVDADHEFSEKPLAFRAFTVAQLEAFGVDVSAVQVSIAAGDTGSSADLKSRFANGSAGWVMTSDDKIVDENGFTRDVPVGSGAKIGRKLSGSGLGRIIDNRTSGGGTSRAASAGDAGYSSSSSAAGVGGAANQTGDGESGGNAVNSDYSYRVISGGGSGGNGGGGGVDGSTPKNGGNGGNGAWPGGYPGVAGTGGRYIPIVGSAVDGYSGFIGSPANGGAIVEAR